MNSLLSLLLCVVVCTTAWAQPQRAYYWVGTNANGVQASGEWTDVNAWRLDSVNGVVPSQVPISNNSVYFMAAAFPTTLPATDSVEITVSSNSSCDSFYWDPNIPLLPRKITFRSNTLGSTGPNTVSLDIYGLFYLLDASKLDFDFNGDLRFRSQALLTEIHTNGNKLLTRSVVFDGSDTTEFRLMDYFHVDDPMEFHYSRNLAQHGGFCILQRGYLNFNGQDALIDRFNAFQTSFAGRSLNIAGSHIQLTGHADYVWRINFNAAGTNYTFFDATGSHLEVREPTDRAYAQQVFLGDMAYDTLSYDCRYYAYLRNNSPTVQHVFAKTDLYFHDNLDADIDHLHLYERQIYRFTYRNPRITVEQVTVNAGCDGFATITGWQGTRARINKKTAGTTLTLNNVILNNSEGDISNGQSYVANNSVDANGNINWTINVGTARQMRFRHSNPTATNHYWHNVLNWEEWNGAAWIAATCLPTPIDDVHFDGASFPATGNHRMRIDSVAYCHHMRWLPSIDNRIELYPYLYTNLTTRLLNIHGTMELDPDLRVACIGRTFAFWGQGDSIITNGVYLVQNMQVQGFARYHIAGTLATRHLQGLVNSRIISKNNTWNLGYLALSGRELDSVDVNLTHYNPYAFRDYGGYQAGISYTGTTTFHFRGTRQYYNCNNIALPDQGAYLYGSSCGSCAGAQSPAHFPNVVFHTKLTGMVYHMTVHGDLTMLKDGNFHYWVNTPARFSQIRILGDQPNSPYNGDMNLSAGREYVFDSYYSNWYASTHANFNLNSKIEIAGTLNAVGNCQNPITIRTYTGKPMTFSAGNTNIAYAYIEGLDNTGNPTIVTTNSVDGGNNTNISFPTATTGVTLYWRANFNNPADFEGNWNDPRHWTTNPASPIGDSACVPSIADTVVFDAMSFSGTSNGCEISNSAFCRTIWVKADARLYSSNLAGGIGHLFVSESMLLDLAMTQYDYSGRLTFTGAGGVIRTSGTPLVNALVNFKTEGSTWELQDPLTLTNPYNVGHGRLELTAGTFRTNNHDMNIANSFWSFGQLERKLDLGTSIVTIQCVGRNPGNGSVFPWYIPNGHRNIDVVGRNSVINFEDNNLTANNLLFYMGYDSLTFRVISNSGSYDQNRIEYGEVNFKAASEISNIRGYASYKHINFLGTAYWTGNNLMDSIEFAGGHFYYFNQNSRQHLNSPHGKIISNGSASNFVNIESFPSGSNSYFHKEWGDYFCLDYIKVKDNEGTKGINPNTGTVDNDLFFYTGTNSDNINGTARGIWNFSLLFSTHTIQAPVVAVCDGQDSIDVEISILGNDYYDIRYNWWDSLGNSGTDTVQLNDDDNDPNTPFLYRIRRPVLASGYYAFDVATFRCDKRTAPAIDTVWVYKTVPSTLVDQNSTASCYLTNKGAWIDFFDDLQAKPVLSLQDSTGAGDTDSLKLVNAEVFFEPTVQYYAGRPYLQRHWRITPENNVGSKVRLYFTQEELDSLYVRTFHGATGLPFGAGMAYLEVWKFDAVPHTNATIGSSAPTIVPHAEIPLVGATRKGFSAVNDVLAIEFEVSSFSHFILVPRLPVLLPLDLLSFEAQKTTKEEVALTWEVRDASDLQQFEILRSHDGINFEPLKLVPATVATSYATLDELPMNGTNYYQLKTTELDGTSSLSAIRVVIFERAQDFAVYPNPTKAQQLNVRFSVEQPSQVEISLVNSLGQLVWSAEKTAQSGSNVLPLNLDDLPAGAYVLRVVQGGRLIGQETVRLLQP